MFLFNRKKTKNTAKQRQKKAIISYYVKKREAEKNRGTISKKKKI